MIKKLILMFLIASLTLSVAYAENSEIQSPSSGAGGGQSQAVNSQKIPVACTMEAKICPDGSSVGRVGPNCEFEPCPTNEEPISAESIKCVFENAETEQSCYSNWYDAGCSGIGSCTTDIKGDLQQKITWKSSCGGYQYTTLDGEDETIYFNCEADENAIVTPVEQNYRYAKVQCDNGSYEQLGGETSCKPYSLWKKYAIEFCNNCPDSNTSCEVEDLHIYGDCEDTSQPNDNGNLQQRIEKLEARVQRLENVLFRIKELIPKLEIDAVDWDIIRPVPTEVIPNSVEETQTMPPVEKMKYKVIKQNEVEIDNIKVKAPKKEKFRIVEDTIYIDKDNKQYEVPTEFIVGDDNAMINVEMENGVPVATKTIVTEKPSWFLGLWKDSVKTEVGKIKLPEVSESEDVETQ